MAEIIIRGPIFTGAAPLLIDKAVREAERAVAAESARRVRLLGLAFFRYESSPPTHQWFRSVRDVARNDYHVATDSGIIYGHWLEGTGSRNRTTRFKGYFMWRKVFQAMSRGGALAIAEPIIARACRELDR